LRADDRIRNKEQLEKALFLQQERQLPVGDHHVEKVYAAAG
jgi:hypothetical protein